MTCLRIVSRMHFFDTLGFEPNEHISVAYMDSNSTEMDLETWISLISLGECRHLLKTHNRWDFF